MVLPEPAVHYKYRHYGYVQPKQRPRVTKQGKAYTPKETVEFEKLIANIVYKDMKAKKMTPLVGTVFLDIIIHDPLRKSWSEWFQKFALLGLFYDEHGDLDNKAKSIGDALNGILYRDDKKIAHLTISREFSDQEGFTIEAGLMNSLMKSECIMLEELLKRG